MLKQQIKILLLLLMASVYSFASEADTSKVEARQKNLSIVPLPVVAYNPSNGLMLGLAPGANWFMGDAATTSISSGLGTVIYTTNKQLILTAKTNVFLSGDRWNLLGDIRYFITSQPTYGLGTGPNSNKVTASGYELDDGTFSKPIDTSQMMEFNLFRFHETVLRRHQSTRFFYGLGYHLDIHSKITDNLLDETADPPVYTSHYLYQEAIGMSHTNYTTSGVSVNLLYDSRDNSINPYSGRYAFANLRLNPEFLGSDKSSSMLWLEYRDYVHFDKKRPSHLLGFWTYAWFVTSGDVPYLDLPALGWDQFGRSGRAYTQGRFRGEDLWYGETEYRFPLQKGKETIGGVAFFNLTTASSRYNDIKLFDYLNYAGGVGLRIMINKKSRTNINLDYAIGQYGQHGFYLGLNEVF